ncbi:MAG: formylglycine-generating enzyme family protein [Microcoleus sp. CAN_BIN18]|nr:formylglycine-generating enzyme family protein [Microcoleus sp. CAN_BIN18]
MLDAVARKISTPSKVEPPPPEPSILKGKTTATVLSGFARRVISYIELLQNFTFNTVTVDAQAEINHREPKLASYLTQYLGQDITLEMVYIPKGNFKMGAPASEAERHDSQKPQHQVTIKPFLLGKYPITQAQWAAVANSPKIQYDLNPDPSDFKGKNLPVESVSWNDAVEFCARLSQKTRSSYRLPSEAEWEYACRAGTTTPFHFGDTVTPDLVNYDGNNPYGSAPKGIYRGKTTVVGSFPPNSFGLYDMHGNIWEWCQDVGHNNYNGAPTDGSAWESGGDSKNRVRRGGSWYGNAVNCRSAYRLRSSVDYRSRFIGFRVARASA